MQNLNASGKVYNLQAVKGTVAASNKNMETTISGGGGNYANQAPIRSTTTVHDSIFLIDSSSKEHSFQLQDFNVACREGNELKVIWATQNGKSSGEYIVVKNYTTEKTFFNTGALRRMFRPSWIYPLALSVILLFISTGLTVTLAFVTWIVYIIYTIQKADSFKKEFNPDEVN